MKILLFLCIIWRLIYINLSWKTANLYVGTTGLSGHSYRTYYDIICYGCNGNGCKINDVIVTLSQGRMTLSGLYGSGQNRKFCEEKAIDFTTGIKKCRILQNDTLDKALIKIVALEKCHNVGLTVTGPEVLSINMHPLIQVDVGTIGMSGHPYVLRYIIFCHSHHCGIEVVEVTLSRGEVALSGFYGNAENKKFCEGQPKSFTTGIKKCKILQRFVPNKAVIQIDAIKECHNVSLIVKGRSVSHIAVDDPYEVYYDLGTLQKLFNTTAFIYCRGTCEIVQVRATLSRGGDVNLKGFYGDGENSKFCEGLPNNGTGIEECKMLKRTELSKARIKIEADKKSHNVTLIVKGYNLYKIFDKPPSEYELGYDVGFTIPVGWPLLFWIYCRGPCDIEEIEATRSKGGDVNLKGFYGVGYISQFCEGLPNGGSVIEKCDMWKRTGLTKAHIRMEAKKRSSNVRLIVRGYNLFKIYEIPPSKYELARKVGLIQGNNSSWFWITCRGHCEIEEVEATLSKGGDINLIGFYGDGENSKFCEGLPNDGSGIEKCKMLKKTGLSKARIKMEANKKSHNVNLIVRGYNLDKIFDKPPSEYELFYDVGHIPAGRTLRFWVQCRGPCEIEDIKVPFRSGFITFSGLHGVGENLTFCVMQSQYHINANSHAKCRLLQKFGLKKPLIKMHTLTGVSNVHLIVRGRNVWNITETPLQEVIYDVGTINMSGLHRFYIICEGSNCTIEDVEVTLYSGFITLSGLHGDGKNSKFCEGQPKYFNPQINQYIKKCTLLQKNLFKKARIKIDALEESHNVSLIVRGHNVTSIEEYCECNPDGVKKNVSKQCNGYGICTCRAGYGGRECYESSAQEVDIADYKYAAFISVYCNGKCKINYIRSTSTKYTDWHGSDKKFYVESVLVSTDGNVFCSGKLLKGVKTSDCENIDQDKFDGDEFHIYAGFYRVGEKAKVQFDADNYLNHTVEVHDYLG